MMVHPPSLRIPRARRYSGYRRLSSRFTYVALTPFGSPSHVIRLRYLIGLRGPYPGGIATSGLASSAFARRY